MNDLIIIISRSLAEKNTKAHLKSKQKGLSKKIRQLCKDFSEEHGQNESFFSGCSQTSDLSGHYIAIWFLLSSVFIWCVRKEMCNGVSDGIEKVEIIVKEAFTKEINDIFMASESMNLKNYQEKIYMLAGYLVNATEKASKQKKDDSKIQIVMKEFTNAVKLNWDDSEAIAKLPAGEVIRVELFGGLKYVTEKFFQFVMRIESVFVSCLKPEYLVMVGSDLIVRVYSSFIDDPGAHEFISSFLTNYDKDDDEVIILTKYVTRTYCRLLGKDFARKMMSRDIKSNVQTTRTTQAVVSQSKFYESKKNTKQEVTVDDAEENLLFQGIVHNVSILDENSNVMEEELLE